MTPTLFVTGILLLIALSVLIQIAIMKWRYEKRKAREKEEAAIAKRDAKRASRGSTPEAP
jgi:Sec-independent protein secretion pathway component TatC